MDHLFISHSNMLICINYGFDIPTAYSICGIIYVYHTKKASPTYSIHIEV